MGKRWLDAVLGALLLIGVLVAMAQFSAAVGNLRFPTAAKRLVAHRTASKKPVASSRNACVLTLNEDPAETRPMLTEPEKESAGIPGFYECELSLWLGKSTILLVCYVLVMMSRCMMNNGSAGIVGRLWVFRWSPSLPSNASQRPIASQTMPLAVPFRLRGLAGRCQAPRCLLFPFWDPGLISSRTASLRLPYCSWPPVQKTRELDKGDEGASGSESAAW